jgi:ketosteroid isomerase-like protein
MQELTKTTAKDAIMAANEEPMAKFKSGDTAGIAEFYTEDGRVGYAPKQRFCSR